MNKFVIRQSLILLFASIIWGVAFVAQSVGMDYVEPFTFTAVRSLIGSIVLLPCIALFRHLGKEKEKKTGQENSVKNTDPRILLKGGICCGVVLCIATNLQQIGLKYTTVGKCGFITAMYIVIVPLLGIFIGKKAGLKIWCGVVLAVAGLYLLCITKGSFSLQKGDLLSLAGALAFSFQILTIDYFSPKVDGVQLSCVQFLVCGILSGICMFLFESPDISRILAAWLPILYAGVLSSGVAYTLQIIGQRGLNPTVASLLMSMESVVSVLAGWLILKQSLSGQELVGCLLIFGAVILVQLPGRKNRLDIKNV